MSLLIKIITRVTRISVFTEDDESVTVVKVLAITHSQYLIIVVVLSEIIYFKEFLNLTSFREELFKQLFNVQLVIKCALIY